MAIAAATSDRSWVAPLPTDRRSPCPMVNTLANHGYLPHDGLNISMADLIVALNESVNLASTATQAVGARALLASTTGDATTFNLDDLNRHGFIEHDGSLSRADTAEGDNHSFNATIWAATTAFFTNPTITLPMAIAARSARLTAAAQSNPSFNMTAGDVQNSAIETALYMSVFTTGGNATEARREWVEYLFANERLPTELGWERSVEELTTEGILTIVGKVLGGN